MRLFQRKRKAPELPPKKPKAFVQLCTDNKLTRANVQAVLEQEDLVITEIVPDGEEVIERWKAYHPHILILDNELYRRDGLDVLRELHETAPEAVTIFMAAFYESSAQEIINKVVQYGVTHVLAKDAKGEIPAENIRAALKKAMAKIEQKKNG